MDKNIINKLTKILKLKKELEALSFEEIKRIYIEKGYKETNISKEKMIELILETSLTPEEQNIYNIYLEYLKKKDYEIISDSIDSLESSVNEIETLLEEKGKNHHTTIGLNEELRKLEILLRTFPLIRAKIEFSHVTRTREDYIHTRTVTGMKQAQMEDDLSALEHSSILLRGLHKKDILYLREELKKFESSRTSTLKKSFNKYEQESQLYHELLKQLFVDFIKNPKIKENIILSCDMYFKLDLPGQIKENGLKELDREFIEDFDPEELFINFLKFANFAPNEDLEPETFYEKLKELILYYLKTWISRLDVQNSRIQTKVNAIYLTQRDYIDILISKKSTFTSKTSIQNEEENAHVYRLQNSNN